MQMWRCSPYGHAKAAKVLPNYNAPFVPHFRRRRSSSSAVRCSSSNSGSQNTQVASPFAASSSTSNSTPRVAQTPKPTAAAESSPSSVPWTTHKWAWNGHVINYASAGCGEPVLLVHGFGASLGHYRRLIPQLAAAGYKVYAPDLLGFGASDKPLQQYSIELWAQLLCDFQQEFAGSRPAVLVGNSIGSLVCLAAAAAAPPGSLRGLVLLNSAGAMNNKGTLSEGDPRLLLALPLLLAVDLLLRVRPLARWLFDTVRRKETLQKVLCAVYGDDDAVDPELVDIIHGPSADPNALDVFVSVITGPPGPKPSQLIPQLSTPMLIAWGDKDPFTPLDGPIGRYMQQLARSRPGTTFAVLPGVGHCPQDDQPQLLTAQLLPWMRDLVAAGSCVAGAPERAA